MKKTILSFAVTLCTLSATAQFTFTASPGVNLNGASFGYKVQKFVPYLSLQMLGAKGTLTESGQENDFGPNGPTIVSFKDEYSAKINVILPTIGAKYFFLESEKLKAYGNLNFSTAIAKGKIENSTDPTNSDDEYLQEVLEQTRFFASQIGFGTEYFFDESFSLGGEFGIQMLRLKIQDNYETTLTDPNNNPVLVTNTSDYSLRVNPSYVKISLNFYFGKKN